MSSQPLHLVAIATLQDGKLQGALDAIKTLTEEAHKNEPGLLRYFCFTTKNEQGQDQVIFVEKYSDEEVHKVHHATAHFQAFGKKAAEFLAGPLVIRSGNYAAGFENRANL
ncbi:hypothetical protein TMatcc_003139 [Talaromyces marneffei ATCC 18224]|uniref:ABM domain-containing protein n=3 Tax=Talaromyces marneffei TaxID=37727 RepID=B6Q5Y8_TALMQ|nr:uncharacterized protein EYB26_001810 [Talaromyces marneffei]EEA28527.1 conserved hypothetical protein [Talaromyces marneffei ATCC 18224]KAE8555847.1 hypothetical protein EYB25_000545 [Talaromyces marneffei]QGA14157.1 hypothetical protein EYB26_001810 [Talaromyces marneffei]